MKVYPITTLPLASAGVKIGLWQRHVRTIIYCTLLCISVQSIGIGQPYPVSVLSVNNGLSSGTIECALFDSRGFLWIGTREGLHRYDGKNITRYIPDLTDPGAIASTNIFFLSEDHYGQIWIIGNNGLEVFIPEDNCFEHLPGVYYDDVAGLRIIDTLDIGIAHSCRSANTFSPFISLRERRFLDHKNELTKEQQTVLDKSWMQKVPNRFFAGEEHQQYNFKKYFNDLNDEVVRCVLEGSEMWFYTRKKGGFTKLTDGRKESEWKPVNHPWPEIEKEGLMTMMSYNDSLGLAGLYGYGILLFHKNTGEVLRSWDFRHNPQLSRISNIEFLTKDDQGRVWFSLMPYGLYVFDPMSPRFQLLRNGEEASLLHQGLMRSLMCDTMGRLWIGYHDGTVQVMDRDVEKELFRFSIPEDRNHVRTMVVTIDQLSYGQILVNNYLSIAVNKENISIKTLINSDTAYESSFHHPVHPPGKISFSYGFPPNSLVVVDTHGLSRYHLPEKLPMPVRTFHINDHLIFFSSSNNRFGLLSCDVSDSCRLISDIRHGDFRILGLYLAPGSDTLWLATDKGLGHYDIKSLVFGMEDTRSWPNSYLYGLLPDDKGNLWISSNAGIIRYHPLTKAWKCFDVKDGMQSNEFNTNCFALMSDGAMAFGGPEGINVFDPAYFTNKKMPFNVHLTGIKIHEIPVADFNPYLDMFSFSIRPYQKSLEIEYTSTVYVDREDIQYYVQLVGAEDDWVDMRNKEFVRYINLKPGDYTFRLKAKNADGEWSMNTMEAKVNVNPNFFQTRWFLLLCILAVLGLVYGLYQYRIRQIKKLQSIRNRISHDLHDDVGSTLGSISIYSEVAKSAAIENRMEVLDKIGEASREMLDKLNDIVWSINPENDTFEKLETRMKGYAAMVLHPKGIEFTIHTNAEENNLSMSMEKRRNLFLIFKEAIYNASKYSECRKVTILLEESMGSIKMEISDDGKGFDMARNGTYNGNGIKSMKERAASLGAILKIQSQPGAGTKIYIDRL